MIKFRDVWIQTRLLVLKSGVFSDITKHTCYMDLSSDTETDLMVLIGMGALVQS